jgi:hypothetical protein
MMGHHFGVPFHNSIQRSIILEALSMLETARNSGEVKRLPFTWANARMEGKRIEER